MDLIRLKYIKTAATLNNLSIIQHDNELHNGASHSLKSCIVMMQLFNGPAEGIIKYYEQVEEKYRLALVCVAESKYDESDDADSMD
jgi:hypothetical protein